MLLIETIIKPSSHGLGLFTVNFIPKGYKVWAFNELTEIIIADYKSQNEIFDNFISTYGYKVDGLGVVVSLDNARFMNHSSTPNLIEIDGCNYAAEDISAGSELTCDYTVFDSGLQLCGNFLID